MGLNEADTHAKLIDPVLYFCVRDVHADRVAADVLREMKERLFTV